MFNWCQNRKPVLHSLPLRGAPKATTPGNDAGLYSCAHSPNTFQQLLRDTLKNGKDLQSAHPCCASTVVTERTIATMRRKTIFRSADIMVARRGLIRGF